jgi:class 3 adenylate cyclase/tetratricopeptide (TPR) repeat protein
MLTCSTCGRESPDDFTFCPVCGATLAAPAPAREQRKTVTVLFCDVTGSTALGEKLDPEALRRVMARYFDEMKGAIERHGGTVEKFIGDAVMAVFGIPRVHEDDALRAVRAAAEMREVLGRLNKELERDQGVALAARIGVNTGEVVAGDPAAGQALVTGDAVNVAARLEQAASPGEVLIGVGTHALVRDAVDAEPVQPLTLKGKAELVSAFRLVSVVEGAGGRARRLDSPMVGRERQLGLLLQAFDGAEADRTCHLFTVLGPAGVGKSRLVAEFLERLGDRAGALRGRCLPYGDGITYFPVVEIVKEAAGLADFDAPDVIESKVCAVLEGDELQESVCATVSQLLGVEEAASPQETHWAIRRFLEARARERPLVVVFDDIHWAESALLDLIEHIADLSRDAPLLLLSMARGELLDLRPAWGGGKLNATTVSLESLADEECELLIANLLGSAGLPRDVAERITGAAEGNPLFVEEMLSMLIDDERLVRSGDSWVSVGELADVAVPPSILALLEARLDRLGPQERAVIERASVVGKVFYAGAIEALFDDDRPPDLGELLIALVRRDLVRPDRSTLTGQETYRFRHQLIRDTAYEGLPKDLRASLHERFAGWLEGVAGDRIEEQEEILAYHLEQAHRYRLQLGPAGDRTRSLAERAALRLFAPARRASERGDHAAAVSLLRRAASLLPTGHPDRAEVLYDLGRANIQVGDVRESFATLDQAVNAADAAGARSLAWLARIARSDAQMLVDPHSKATDEFRAELDQALAVFEELDDERGLASTWTELALIEWIPCRFADAEHAAELAVAHARVAGDARLLSEAIFILLAAQVFGDATSARGIRTLEACRSEVADDLQMQGVYLVCEAFWRSMDGDFDQARVLIERSRAITEGLGLRLAAAIGEEVLGSIEMYAGDPVAAERAFRKNYTLLVEIGDESHASMAAAELARSLCWLGRFDEAEGYARIARETAADDDLAPQVVGRSAQALVLAARGDLEGAERTARDAVEMFANAQCPNVQGDLWLDLAEVLRRAGKPSDAADAVRAGLALFERKGNRPAAAQARELLAELAT